MRKMHWGNFVKACSNKIHGAVESIYHRIVPCQITVFWGGREGYQSLLNTDIKRELDHMAAFFKMAVGKHKVSDFLA